MGRVLLVLVLALGSSSLALAGEDVAEAERLFKAMHYEKAYAAAAKVLESSEARPEDIKAAYEVSGLSLAATGREDEAAQVFRRLLAVDPAHRLSADLSPKLSAPFYRAKGMAPDQPAIALEHQPPPEGSALAGQTLTATLGADPLGMVAAIRLRWWTPDSGQATVESREVQGPGPVSFQLPADLSSNQVSYTFEALNRHRGALVAAGGGQPFTLKTQGEKPVPTVSAQKDGDKADRVIASTAQPGGHEPGPAVEEGAPVYEKWWFWTIIGVVVLGAATTAVVFTVDGPINPTSNPDFNVGWCTGCR